MTKWLLLAAVGAVAWWWLSRGRYSGRSGRGTGPGPENAPHASSGTSTGAGAPGPAEPEPMVACAHCGLLLPRSDAVPSAAQPDDGRVHYFCCEAHRRAGPGRS
ncbi:MAG: PP0621 family protein [Betaproteobacteria bacterium]